MSTGELRDIDMVITTGDFSGSRDCQSALSNYQKMEELGLMDLVFIGYSMKSLVMHGIPAIDTGKFDQTVLDVIAETHRP